MRNLTEYAQKCMAELDTLEIQYGNVVEFKVNYRAKKRWGQCKRLSDGTFSININAIFLDERNEEQGLKNTIIHELLHTCTDCFNHGKIGNGLRKKCIVIMVMTSKGGARLKKRAFVKKRCLLNRLTLSLRKYSMMF